MSEHLRIKKCKTWKNADENNVTAIFYQPIQIITATGKQIAWANAISQPLTESLKHKN